MAKASARRTSPGRGGRPGEGSGNSKNQSNRLEALRSSKETAAPDRLLLATLRIRIPKGLWAGQFSRDHPSVMVEILNRSDTSAHLSVSDHWISGQPPGVWAREIGAYADVVKVDSLAELAEGSLYRITYHNPPVIYLYRKLGLPIQFPLRIQGGYIRWEVVARHSEFDRVLKYARVVDPEFQLVSIRRRPLRSHLPLLTDGQNHLLTAAMAAGYFAVPRGITLTDLARQLNRSKSSVSEAIAIIERKLLESAVRPALLPA